MVRSTYPVNNVPFLKKHAAHSDTADCEADLMVRSLNSSPDVVCFLAQGVSLNGKREAPSKGFKQSSCNMNGIAQGDVRAGTHNIVASWAFCR